MSNNSATGGYIVPSSNPPLPGNLTFEQFLHNIIAGISGYTNTLVRPKWQENPPKYPSIETDWIAYGVTQNTPDANAYTGLTPQGVDMLQRNETIQIQVTFYGPNKYENIGIFRDGFQMTQNLEAMLIAGMGFKEISPAIFGPDLVNGRWLNKYETTLTLVRCIVRTYPVLSFASAVGSVHTVIADEDKTIPFGVEEPES